MFSLSEPPREISTTVKIAAAAAARGGPARDRVTQPQVLSLHKAAAVATAARSSSQSQAQFKHTRKGVQLALHCAVRLSISNCFALRPGNVNATCRDRLNVERLEAVSGRHLSRCHEVTTYYKL